MINRLTDRRSDRQAGGISPYFFLDGKFNGPDGFKSKCDKSLAWIMEAEATRGSKRKFYLFRILPGSGKLSFSNAGNTTLVRFEFCSQELIPII